MDHLCSLIVQLTEKGAFDEVVQIFESGTSRNHTPLALASLLNRSDSKPHPTTGVLFAMSSFLIEQPVSTDPRDVELFITNFEQFVRSADYTRQILGVASGASTTFARLRKLINTYVETTVALGFYRRCIATLRLCAEKFSPSPAYLTLAHAPLVEVALRFNIPGAAVGLMSRPVLEIDPKKTGVELPDYMAYFYYSAMVHVAFCQWPEALKCAHVAIAIPGVGNSCIILAAAKLYLLLGVIVTGKKLSLSNTMLEKYLGALAPEYSEFVATCEAHDFDKMAKLELSGRARFSEDGLVGLVRQTRGFVLRQAIKGLTKVYVTLSIADVSGEAKLDEAQTKHVLCTMIEEGEVHGTLDGDVVTFYDAPPANAAVIEDAITDAQQSLKRLEEADRVVSLNHFFLAEKLRSLPNYRQLVEEYEAKQKTAKGMLSRLADLVTK
jgi:hypothetical protein